MKTIKDIAHDLVKYHGTNNPFQIAKERGIHIIFEDLGSICGYYHYYHRVQLIHINHNLDEPLQRFVCAHELGHAIQHKTLNTAYLSKHTLFSTNRLEVEANTFAVELLLPDEEFCALQLENQLNTGQIAKLYGIPEQFVQLKC